MDLPTFRALFLRGSALKSRWRGLQQEFSWWFQVSSISHWIPQRQTDMCQVHWNPEWGRGKLRLDWKWYGPDWLERAPHVGTTSAQVRQTFTFTWTSKKLGTGRVGHREWSQNNFDFVVQQGRPNQDPGSIRSELRKPSLPHRSMCEWWQGQYRVTWCNMVDSQKQLYSQVVTLKLNTHLYSLQCQACNCYTVRHFENHSENHLYWVWESLCIQFKNCKSLLGITLRIAFRNSQRVEHEVRRSKKTMKHIPKWCNLMQFGSRSIIRRNWMKLVCTLHGFFLTHTLSHALPSGCSEHFCCRSPPK